MPVIQDAPADSRRAALDVVRAMPKVELHRHLEGSLRLETLLSIALEHSITVPGIDLDGLRPHVQMMPDEPHDWQHFLGKFTVLRKFYRSEKIIKRVAEEVVADAAADNVKYMELRFTPQALNNIMRCQYGDVVTWVCEAVRAACLRYGIEVNLIVSMNRHESTEIAEEVIEAALAHVGYGVVGIDLAGQEANFSARPFRSLFERAKENGLGITVHAGEWAGAASVREVVEELGATRIGHGIRAIEDPTLVDLLLSQGTVLEVCPTSNVHSGVVAQYSSHPIVALTQAGVRTTINTDDPLISNITLSDELAAVIDHTPLTLDDLKRQQLTAVRAAFIPPERRAELATQFGSWFANDSTG
jgi:adenosine deaminase